PVAVVIVAEPGRARLRASAVPAHPVLAAGLADRISGDTGVREVRANHLTGSVLVSFDPARVDARAVMAAVRRHARGVNGHGNGHRTATEGWHLLPTGEVLERLASPGPAGLSSEEAQRRLATVGANRLPMPEPKSPLAILSGHLTSLPVLLLGGAAALSLLSAAPIEAAVILAVVAANATVGYVTERRVERVLTSLQSTTTPRASVRRDGAETVLPAAAVVP